MLFFVKRKVCDARHLFFRGVLAIFHTFAFFIYIEGLTFIENFSYHLCTAHKPYLVKFYGEQLLTLKVIQSHLSLTVHGYNALL